MVDLLPETLQRWQAVEAMARDHFRRSGFGEIRTPLLETTDLFCRGIGEGTDVVGKEMYTFQDRGDRSCTLRPEGTASVVRTLQHGCSARVPRDSGTWDQCFATRDLRRVGSGSSIDRGGMAGAEQPVDVEVIALAWDLLASLGVGGLQLELNSLGTAEDRKTYRNALVAWLEQRSRPSILIPRRGNPTAHFGFKNKDTQALLEDA